MSQFHLEAAVRERYSEAARQVQTSLCCPVEYRPELLSVIPDEVLERDYGCGDPSRWLAEGETVLDLGSGGGKICFIASQIVGPQGRVIGVDANDEMLTLARRHQATVAARIGYDNVEFRKGRIQDLALDLDAFEERLRAQPVSSSSDWLRAEAEAGELRRTRPLIPSETIDVVVSNCVLNLVGEADRRQLFGELHRVLKGGGRAVISDIVCDEEVPEHLRQDPRLWSGCISGAFREDLFLEAFAEAGLYGVEIVARQAEPWTVVEGIEFRSLTVRAFKGKEGPSLDRRQAVMYQGPWQRVYDDDGHCLVRGRRTAVSDKMFQIYSRPPYADHVLPIPPRVEVPLDQAVEFHGQDSPLRPARETKAGGSPSLTVLSGGACCGPTGCC